LRRAIPICCWKRMFSHILKHNIYSFLYSKRAIRYHHVLKSIWLEGKRNRRVDHLIHTLVMEFLPDLEFRHKRQTLGMNGPNLAEKRRRQILTRAPETPLAKIKKIDDLRFEVQSSKSTKSYQIDLNTTSCDCSDFPRIRLCKHIASVVHFFGGVDLGPQPPVNTGTSESVGSNSPDQQDGNDGSTDDSAVVSAANEIISLSHELILKAPRDPRLARSLKSIQSRLSALVLSATAAGDGSHLPEKENIGPNQLSWPETAMRMGVKRGNKTHRKGKVDSALTAEHIGEPNRKRPADDDPYGAGEQSGKRAKPDARSAAANARARAAAERAVPKAVPPPTFPPSTQLPPPSLPSTPLPPPSLPPTPLPPPASLPLPAALPHSPYTYNPYYFHPPQSQPVGIYSHSQGSAPYHHAYPFSTYSFHHVA
jgi:hypothetical protein